MACLWDSASHGEPTRYGNSSRPELHRSSQRSEIRQPDHSSTIGNFDRTLRSVTSIEALLNSNLPVRSTYLPIRSHTNRLIHCGTGDEIMSCVCVFSDFVTSGDYILYLLVFEILIFTLKVFKIISCVIIKLSYIPSKF